MAFGSWTPFKKEKDNGSNVPMRRGGSEGGLTRLQQEMNRMFEDFLSSAGSTALPSQFFGDVAPRQFVPRTDISESDNMLMVNTELPGMDADDVEINVHEDRLQIRGEKQQQQEEKDAGYYRAERSFGSFERTIPLPEDVDADNAEATFKNGVLTVKVPVVEGKRKGRKIEIKRE